MPSSSEASAVPGVTKLNLSDKEKELDFANYFHSYGYLYHQKDMLQDRARMNGYRDAILNNRLCFKDKVVLDVGTGSGILSIWAAQAGARRVYAVEATSMAQNARKLAHANGVGDIVVVLEGYMEQLTLPEEVDVILSEWMGYFLLRESMFDSVITSRDRYLKPGGALYPSDATLYIAPLCCHTHNLRASEYVEEVGHWGNFGHYMERFNSVRIDALDPQWQREQYEYLLQTAHWAQLGAEEIIGESFSALELDCNTCSVEDISRVSAAFRSTIHEVTELNAFGGWFDVLFRGSKENPAPEEVPMTTAPPGNTHWGQQVFLVSPPIRVLAGDVLEGKILLTRQQVNHRLMWLQIRFTHSSGGVVSPERTLNFKID